MAYPHVIAPPVVILCRLEAHVGKGDVQAMKTSNIVPILQEKSTPDTTVFRGGFVKGIGAPLCN